MLGHNQVHKLILNKQKIHKNLQIDNVLEISADVLFKSRNEV